MKVEDRFWSKVNKRGSCWLWTGARSSNGAGMFMYKDKTRTAYRMAWFLAYGIWPKQLNHSCDNRLCVNVLHLYDGTQAQNWEDAWARDRVHFPPPKLPENHKQRVAQRKTVGTRGSGVLEM